MIGVREWQQTKFKDLVMPDAVYYQSIWAVRDLVRMEDELRELEHDINTGALQSTSIVSDGESNYSISRPTEYKAIQKAQLKKRVEAIHDALDTVPLAYRQFILDNIIKQKSYKCFPNKLWRIWKQKFLFHVARNLEIM